MNVNQVSVVPNNDSVEVIENRSLLYGGEDGKRKGNGLSTA